jgi:hypothetical protein
MKSVSEVPQRGDVRCVLDLNRILIKYTRRGTHDRNKKSDKSSSSKTEELFP